MRVLELNPSRTRVMKTIYPPPTPENSQLHHRTTTPWLFEQTYELGPHALQPRDIIIYNVQRRKAATKIINDNGEHEYRWY